LRVVEEEVRFCCLCSGKRTWVGKDGRLRLYDRE
jgi:hypothetical protein